MCSSSSSSSSSASSDESSSSSSCDEETKAEWWNELLEQPVVEWDKINLRDVPESKKRDAFVDIICANPPKVLFEAILPDWIKHREENTWGGFSILVYDALAESDVDAEIMEAYFKALQEEGRKINGYFYLKEYDVASLCPDKLQCLLSFLTPENGAEQLAHQLLSGKYAFYSYRTDLWDDHDQEDWERLQAIVYGMNNETHKDTPFLEQYLNALHLAFGGADFPKQSPREIHLENTLRSSKWRAHLKLTSMFAPELFMEQDPKTGNTFLNYFLRLFNDNFACSMCFELKCTVLKYGLEAACIPNRQGRTPLGHICQYLELQDRLHSVVSTNYCRLFKQVSEISPSTLASWTVGSTGRNAEPSPLLIFLGGVVALNDWTTIGRAVSVLLAQLTDDYCNKAADRFGNTALHIAIEKSGKSTQLSLVREVFPRLMTHQANLTRNKDGKLPIDLALEGDKQPWISEALSEVAPSLLEYRSPVSKWYPFQMMASSAVRSGDAATDDTTERLSACYSLLRMAPCLVATTLTEEKTAFIQQAKFIEASRLHLEIEREWMVGDLKAKALQRIFLEQRHRCDSRKRKRLQDVERLVEENNRQSSA